ncbi:MAG: hypothetical protein AAF039_03130 [Bacteroidota bacterium]
MKKLRLLLFLFTSMLIFSCSETPIEEILFENEEQGADQDPDNDTTTEMGDTEEEDTSDEDAEDPLTEDEDIEEENSSDAMEISLEASPDIITNNGQGEQSWGEGVTLEAFKIDGSSGNLVYDTEFRDKGFGVAGARWDQIDYYVMYQGEEVNTSEKIVISFEEGATEITLTVGMMGANEGHSDGETGQWTGFDQNGNQVAEGVLGANNSALGSEIKLEDSSYGLYPIALASEQPIFRLEIEATGFGYGEGEPEDRNYDNESGNRENNSDFNIAGISFTKI